MGEGNTSYAFFNTGTEFWTNLETTNSVLTIANLEREHTMVVRREFGFTDAPALPRGKDFHLYFSYHCGSPDRDKMKAIVRELEYKGYKCKVFERDFDATKDLAANIRHAMDKSLKIVVVLSTAYIKNEWNHLEMVIMTCENANKLFCVPVLIEPCDIPPFLKYFKYINAMGAKETWWNQFLNSVRGDAPKLPRRKRYHVFIAHAPSDAALAAEIADDLESAEIGLVCSFSARDFKSVTSISRNIEHFMKRSMKMVILLSNDFLLNHWKKYYDGKIRIKRLIPMILQDCSVPSMFDDYDILDARRDKREWFPVIVSALKDYDVHSAVSGKTVGSTSIQTTDSAKSFK